MPALLTDLAVRFTPSAANDYEGGLEEILLPLFTRWNMHLLMHKLDIGGGPAASGSVAPSWRDILQAVQSLTEIKLIAATLPTMQGWDLAPEQAQAPRIEYMTLLGPLLRLSTFPDGAVSEPRVAASGSNVQGTETRTFSAARLATSLLPGTDVDGTGKHRQRFG